MPKPIEGISAPGGGAGSDTTAFHSDTTDVFTSAGLFGKVTLVDADAFLVENSVSPDLPVYHTWANFKDGIEAANLVVTGTRQFDGNVGFYATTPIAKPEVTGSRAGNAALADLLTELANLGLITDSTSA